MGKKDEKVELTEIEKAEEVLSNADSDEDRKRYKKRMWQHKLRLGKHYRIERFGILLFTLMTMLIVTFGISFNKQRIRDNALIGVQAKYTESIEFSLSGASGTIRDIYRNTAGTRAFILIKLSDVSQLSLNAENYQMFLTGVEGELEYEPEASMFIFGSDGHVGLEFYDERGLSNELYDIVLRNNSKVTVTEELDETIMAELDDVSFGEFDQAQIYANVGADSAVINNILDEDVDPTLLYYALVGYEEEDKIYDRISENTKKLNKLLLEFDEYSSRLSELGFETIDMPNYMRGDYVDDDGHFKPKTYVDGAHRIDYIDVRVSDGFLNQVVNEDIAEFREYMADQRAKVELAANDKTDNGEDIERIVDLVRTDGLELSVEDITGGDSTTNERTAVDVVSKLNEIISSYLQVKRDLQINNMRELIMLDANILAQSNAFSQHQGDDFLVIW